MPGAQVPTTLQFSCDRLQSGNSSAASNTTQKTPLAHAVLQTSVCFPLHFINVLKCFPFNIPASCTQKSVLRVSVTGEQKSAQHFRCYFSSKRHAAVEITRLIDACGEGSVISFIMGTVCVWEETVER